MDHDEYAAHDGLGLAQLVSTGEVSAADLLEAARARATAVDGRVNAICRDLDEEADARVREDLSGPFAGVPFLVKDLHQDIAGIPTACGCRALAAHRAPHNATVVDRWLEAGLVLFGKTSTPEFGAKGITEPELFGPTRNPWDLSRTPGGSSGGAAAAVAAGIVPVAGASDGGGSIRIPAACTGLFGLKAGRGLLPSGPAVSEALMGMATHGVISRSVRDTAAMLDVLAGPDAVASYVPGLPQMPLLDEVGRDPGRLRIGFTTGSAIRSTPHPEAVRAVQAAATLLEGLGHEVEEVDPPHDDAQMARDFLSLWFVHQALQVREAKRLTGAGDDAFEQDTLLMAALGRASGAVEVQGAEQRRHDHIAALASFHATHDLLLTPTLGEPPIPIGSLNPPWAMRAAADVLLRTRTTTVLRRIGAVDQLIDKNLAWVPYTQLANVTGRPAMSVPLYWSSEGLPLGLQFVAPLAGEGMLLRLAAQLEQAQPWADRRPPL